MSITAEPPVKLWTLDEFLALPDDGIERWLIRGQLRARPTRFHVAGHAAATAQIAYLLSTWRDRQEERGGQVHCRLCFALARQPDTIVPLDIAFISREQADTGTDDDLFVEGPPRLAVDILSPDDQIGHVNERTTAYLAAGAPLVWVVNPYCETVTVFRPDRRPEMFNTSQELNADPHLPGFKVPVARVFED